MKITRKRILVTGMTILLFVSAISAAAYIAYGIPYPEPEVPWKVGCTKLYLTDRMLSRESLAAAALRLENPAFHRGQGNSDCHSDRRHICCTCTLELLCDNLRYMISSNPPHDRPAAGLIGNDPDGRNRSGHDDPDCRRRERNP